MEIKNKDLKLLKALFDSSEPLTIYNLTKQLHPKIKDSTKIADKSSPVRQRVEKLQEQDLIIEIKFSQKSKYDLNRENVKFVRKSELSYGRFIEPFGAFCKINLNGDLKIFQLENEDLD